MEHPFPHSVHLLYMRSRSSMPNPPLHLLKLDRLYPRGHEERFLNVVFEFLLQDFFQTTRDKDSVCSPAMTQRSLLTNLFSGRIASAVISRQANVFIHFDITCTPNSSELSRPSSQKEGKYKREHPVDV